MDQANVPVTGTHAEFFVPSGNNPLIGKEVTVTYGDEVLYGTVVGLEPTLKVMNPDDHTFIAEFPWAEVDRLEVI